MHILPDPLGEQIATPPGFDPTRSVFLVGSNQLTHVELHVTVPGLSAVELDHVLRTLRDKLAALCSIDGALFVQSFPSLKPDTVQIALHEPNARALDILLPTARGIVAAMPFAADRKVFAIGAQQRLVLVNWHRSNGGKHPTFMLTVPPTAGLGRVIILADLKLRIASLLDSNMDTRVTVDGDSTVAIMMWPQHNDGVSDTVAQNHLKRFMAAIASVSAWRTDGNDPVVELAHYLPDPSDG